MKQIIIVNLTTHELKLIAKKRNIQDHKKISREELLRTFDESEHFFKNLSQNGSKQIAKIENLSQNEIKLIIKMQNLSRNKLEQITKQGVLKNTRICQKKNYQSLF